MHDNDACPLFNVNLTLFSNYQFDRTIRNERIFQRGRMLNFYFNSKSAHQFFFSFLLSIDILSLTFLWCWLTATRTVLLVWLKYHQCDIGVLSWREYQYYFLCTKNNTGLAQSLQKAVETTGRNSNFLFLSINLSAVAY